MLETLFELFQCSKNPRCEHMDGKMFAKIEDLTSYIIFSEKILPLSKLHNYLSLINFFHILVPSWPLNAHAVVMTLSIENQMAEVGKFLFDDEEDRFAIDELWDHTQLRVVKDKAMVVCR